MKKVITTFLLLLLGLSSIGLYPVFKLIQLHAKEIAKNITRHRSASDLIVFSDLHNNKDVCWEEENKEFSYHGKRYDIAKEEIEEGNILYYCYNDKKESDIVHRINVLVNEQQGNHNAASKNIVLNLMIMLAQTCVPAEHFSLHPRPVTDDAGPAGGFPAAQYTACVLEIPLPPPWA